MLGTSSFRGQDVSAPQTTRDPGPEKTESSSKNGFVRPVAVSSIFRPASESETASKKPLVPEKRRFSALIGDLTPCNDSSEEFARRRQSWDARSAAPFGQNLLKKTPRNKTLPPTVPEKADLPSPETENNNTAAPSAKSLPVVNGGDPVSDPSSSLKGQPVRENVSENSDRKDNKRNSRNQDLGQVTVKKEAVKSTLESIVKDSSSAVNVNKSQLTTRSVVHQTRSEGLDESSVKGNDNTSVSKGYHVSKLISTIKCNETSTEVTSTKYDSLKLKDDICEQKSTSVVTNSCDNALTKAVVLRRRKVATDTKQKDPTDSIDSSKSPSICSNSDSFEKCPSNDKSGLRVNPDSQSTNTESKTPRSRVYGLSKSCPTESQATATKDVDKLSNKQLSKTIEENVPESSQKRSRVYGVGKREVLNEKVVQQTDISTVINETPTAFVKSSICDSTSVRPSEVSKPVDQTNNAELSCKSTLPLVSASSGDNIRVNSNPNAARVLKEKSNKILEHGSVVNDSNAQKLNDPRSGTKVKTSSVKEDCVSQVKPKEVTNNKTVSTSECTNKESVPENVSALSAGIKSPVDLISGKEVSTSSADKEVPVNRQNSTSTPKQEIQAFESKSSPPTSTNKIEELPKNVRMARRTSDLIASKIQNIFSKVSNDNKEPAKPLSRKLEKGSSVKLSEQNISEPHSSEGTNETIEKSYAISKTCVNLPTSDALSATLQNPVKEAGKLSAQRETKAVCSEFATALKESSVQVVNTPTTDSLSTTAQTPVKETEKPLAQKETKAIRPELSTVSKQLSVQVVKTSVEKPLSEPNRKSAAVTKPQTSSEPLGKSLKKAEAPESSELAKSNENKTSVSVHTEVSKSSGAIPKYSSELKSTMVNSATMPPNTSASTKATVSKPTMVNSATMPPNTSASTKATVLKPTMVNSVTMPPNTSASTKTTVSKPESESKTTAISTPSKNGILPKPAKPEPDVCDVVKSPGVSKEVVELSITQKKADTVKSEVKVSVTGQSKVEKSSISTGTSCLNSKEQNDSQSPADKEKVVVDEMKSTFLASRTDQSIDSKQSAEASYEIENGSESFKFYMRAKNLEDAKSRTDYKRHSSYVTSSANSLDLTSPSSSIWKGASAVDIVSSGISDSPRPPERKRFSALRDPSLPLSNPPYTATVTRTGSLKRFEDPKMTLERSFAVLRSPSQSCVPSPYNPHRYSYTEMLSKVCGYGITPSSSASTSSLPGRYKKYNTGSLSQVSELWSDLTQEQSSAAHTSEILEGETTERMRLEKEVQDLQSRFSHVQQKSDKMEMEMMEARVYRSSGVNGDLSDEEVEGDGSIYKQKYERAVRDMEIMKRRIQQQHEEEVEQNLLNKKAADKKLAEALEDVEEERQVANQWKRKAQKLSSELQDIRLMLEEQMARNGELEKKQRRFDSELNASQEEIKKERLLREKSIRERDQALQEKYSLDQELHSTRLDMDMQHEKITQLNRELDELALSSKGEEEVTQLKRAKQELERKCRDQEEELEELAGQVQMLEQAKLRLEMSLEKLRQEHRRESSVREEEIEELRASFSKKVKNLEAQLETEQEDRHQLVKQKHELERRLIELTDQPPPQDPEIERRLRRDLKRTKALLKDAQSMLEHVRDGQGNKSIIRQLKNQLEDAEFAKCAAIKAKQAAEMELQDLQSQFEEVTRTKNDAESRCLQLSREKSAVQTQLEEMEEELSEVMKKYKAAVAQMSLDQKTISEQNQQITELEAERHALKEQLSEVNTKFEHLAGQSEDAMKVHRLDSKVRELESKLELEQTTRARVEHQITRLKEQIERLQEECDGLRNKENQAQEGIRRLQRQIRDLREDYAALQQKEADAYRKQHEMETALENAESDLKVTKNDLRLACQRIEELKNALEDDLDSGTDVPDDSGSDSDSSLDMSVLRHSLTPIQRCDSVSSDLSFGGRRSTTPSMGYEFSAMCRAMLRQSSMDFLT